MGSEMCIRDSPNTTRRFAARGILENFEISLAVLLPLIHVTNKKEATLPSVVVFDPLSPLLDPAFPGNQVVLS